MEFQWTTDEGVAKRILFDTSDEENPETNLTPTEHPLEDGSSINDHLIKGQTRIRLRATISNTPTRVPETQFRDATGEVSSTETGESFRNVLTEGAKGGGGSPTEARYEEIRERLQASVLQFTGDFDRVVDVYLELVGLQEQKQLFTLVTSLRSWDNCALILLSAPRTAETANAVEFSMELRVFEFVESQTVEAPQPQQPRGTRQEAAGSQNAEEVDDDSPEGQNVSLAVQGLQQVGVL